MLKYIYIYIYKFLLQEKNEHWAEIGILDAYVSLQLSQSLSLACAGLAMRERLQ